MSRSIAKLMAKFQKHLEIQLAELYSLPERQQIPALRQIRSALEIAIRKNIPILFNSGSRRLDPVPTVYIPTLLRGLTAGGAAVEVEGATVREIVDNLEKACPGIRARLLEQDRLRPNISVAVDGRISPLGLLERVSPSSEVHFIAAVAGGASE